MVKCVWDCLGLTERGWPLAERKAHTPARIFCLESCCHHPPQAPAKSTSTHAAPDKANTWKWRKIGCRCQDKRFRKELFIIFLVHNVTYKKIKRCRASESELKLQGFCGDCITLTHTKLGTHLDSWIGSLENTEKRTDLTWQWFGIRFSNNWSTIYQLLAVSGVDTRAEQKRITLLHIETIAAYDAIP